jgi:hypothetical protein
LKERTLANAMFFDGLLPNMRMKLSWRGGRLKGKGSILIAVAAPRSLCAIR